jgi:TRAP transporter TAXI family solute receptor
VATFVAASLLAVSCNYCAFGIGRETRLTLAAGPPETVAACVARAFTSRLNTEHPEQHATVLRTNGAIESLLALREGRADLAIAEADTLAQAVNAEGPFEGRTVPARTLATLYSSRVYLMVREGTEINGFSQLRGHTVGTGPDGSGMRLTLERALDAARLGEKISITPHSWRDLQRGLSDGQIAAIAWSDGLPSPAIVQATEREPGRFRFLSSGSAVPLLERRYGASLYERAETPKGTYGADVPTDSVAVSSVLVARHDLEEPIAFQVTSALFRLSPAVRSVCPAIGRLTPSTAARSQPAALHGGAALFYREAGDSDRD